MAISQDGDEKRLQRSRYSRIVSKIVLGIIINAANVQAYIITYKLYVKLHIKFLLSYGMLQKEKQEHKDESERNYGYIDTLRKSMINKQDPSRKEDMSNID